MTVWFTSDLHLGHQKVAETRGFDSAAEHDVSIYASLEDHLNRGDQLWVLGDMTVGGTGAEAQALKDLGSVASFEGVEMHLVAGNHDSCHPMANRNSHSRQRVFMETFTSVQLFARRRIAGQPVMLSHFPYRGDHTAEDRGMQYRLPDRGEWILHGHTHSKQVEREVVTVFTEVAGGPIKKHRMNKQIHVGWDAWHRPVSLVEIEEAIDRGVRSEAL